MKWFAFKLIALLCVLLAAPMFIKGPDGLPIMSLDDWIPRDLFNTVGDAGRRAAGLAGDIAGEAVAQDGERVYSWRDANGTLHFSDTPVQGASEVAVPDNTLEIPAERFVQDGTRPLRETSGRKSGQAILLRERGGRSGSGEQRGPMDTSDLEALVQGDYSKTDDVLKKLPAILEQAKQARAMPAEAR